MPTNDFIGFASSGSANIMSQADYAASAEQTDGVQPGPASSELANKVWRQGANMAAAIAGLINSGGYDALDNGDIATLKTNLSNALAALYLSLSGGTMSGTIVATTHPALSRQNDNSYLALCGGTTNNVANGAFMYLYGAGAGQPGAFRIYTGGTSHNLFGKSDGTLTWDGSDIFTSDNCPVTSTTSSIPYSFKQKFANGFMIQAYYGKPSTDSNSQFLWTYPEAYIEDPFVSISNAISSQTLNLHQWNKTRTIINVCNTTGAQVGSGVATEMIIITFGRWK